MTTGIGGTIRGRIASDGRILIELSTNRRDALTLHHEAPRRVRPAGGRGYVESAGGRKYLQLAPGETVGVKIPAKTDFMSARAGEAPLSGSGRVALRGSDAAAMTAKQTQPVELVNGSIRVYFKPFFEGHEPSLILKVRRVE